MSDLEFNHSEFGKALSVCIAEKGFHKHEFAAIAEISVTELTLIFKGDVPPNSKIVDLSYRMFKLDPRNFPIRKRMAKDKGPTKIHPYSPKSADHSTRRYWIRR